MPSIQSDPISNIYPDHDVPLNDMLATIKVLNTILDAYRLAGRELEYTHLRSTITLCNRIINIWEVDKSNAKNSPQKSSQDNTSGK